MLIKIPEKLRKRTLPERIYEEVVRLILAGELPSGGWVDEKRVIDKLRVSRTPFREAIGILAKGGLVEIKPYRGFYVRSFSRSETADLYELFKRLECFAVELSVPQMSDCDIRRFEDMLIEAGAALQRGDAKTYAMRDREFYENLAEQPENSALIEALARVALQISSAAQWQAWARSLLGGSRTAATTSYKHSRPAILCAPPSRSRPHQPYAGGHPCELSR
jgi:DNA-binding GntR family transcriptional regulator